VIPPPGYNIATRRNICVGDWRQTDGQTDGQPLPLNNALSTMRMGFGRVQDV